MNEEITVSRKSSTKWNLFFLYFSSLTSIVRGFVLVPLYLTYINATLYGAWLASGNLLVWLTMIDPGIGDIITQKISFYYGQKDKNRMQYYISASIIISAIIAILCFIIGMVLTNYLADVLNINKLPQLDELKLSFEIMILSTAFTLFYYSLSGSLLGFQKTKEVGIVRNASNIIGISATIIFLITGFGLMAIPLGALINSILMVAGLSFFLLRIYKSNKINWALNIKIFKEFSSVFSYTFIAKISSTITNNIDLILVARYIDINTVTALELTRRPIKILQSFVQQPSIAFMPGIAHLKGEGDTTKLHNVIKRLIIIYVWTLLFAAAGFILYNGDLIKLWVGEIFYLGTYYNTYIVIILTVGIIYSILNQMTFSLGNIVNNSILETIRNLVTIILLYLFVKQWGLLGILVAPVIPILLFALPYQLRWLQSLTNLTISQTREIIKELSFTIVLLAVLGVIAKFFIITGYLDLVFNTAAYTILFIFVMYVVSFNFKQELKGFFNIFLSFKAKILNN